MLEGVDLTGVSHGCHSDGLRVTSCLSNDGNDLNGTIGYNDVMLVVTLASKVY